MAKAKIPKILKSDKRIYILAAVCVILVTSVVFGRGPVSRENLINCVDNHKKVGSCGNIKNESDCNNSYKIDDVKGAFRCDWRSEKCKFISGDKGDDLKCDESDSGSNPEPAPGPPPYSGSDPEPAPEPVSGSGSSDDEDENNTMLIVGIIVGIVILLGGGYYVYTQY